MPGVAYVMTCAECEQQWLPEAEERWRAHHVGDDLDEPAELVFFCPQVR